MRKIIFLAFILLSLNAYSNAPIFHPFCMEEFVESDWDKPFDMGECHLRNPVTNIAPQESDSKKQTYYLDKVNSVEDGGGWAGYVRYTIAAQKKNIFDIEYVFSGGGSGSFYRVFTFRVLKDDLVEMLAFIPFGDRCNDGGAKFEKSYAAGDGQVVISSYATPFRLLNIQNRFNWREAGWVKAMMRSMPNVKESDIKEKIDPPELLNGWLPYDDIDNSAASCVGRIHWKFDESINEWFPLKVEFNEGALVDISDKKETNECISKWLSDVGEGFGPIDENKAYSLSGQKWQKLVSKLPKYCSRGAGFSGWINSRF